MSSLDIQYLEGDATAPLGRGPRIIAHICNDIGGWGKGFVLALSKKWKAPEQEYRSTRPSYGSRLGWWKLGQN